MQYGSKESRLRKRTFFDLSHWEAHRAEPSAEDAEENKREIGKGY